MRALAVLVRTAHELKALACRYPEALRPTLSPSSTWTCMPIVFDGKIVINY